ncbi:MAG: hypothetical protein GF329_12295 [Candidatus Lokiarchaeota archaeon]|nr:hypothetical protein [Candidatus Lokiarchaeota archaeon]
MPNNQIKNKYKDIITILILMVGVLNKETLILIIPIYFLLQNTTLIKRFFKTVIISSPAIILLISLRLIPYSGTYEEVWLLIHIENMYSTLYNIFLTFGFFWFLAFFNFENENFFLRRTYWILPIFIAQIILASNIFRLIFLSFPIVIPLGLRELKKYKKNLEFGNTIIIFALSSQLLITNFYVLKKYLAYDFLNIVYFPLIGVASIILLGISLILYVKK